MRKLRYLKTITGGTESLGSINIGTSASPMSRLYTEKGMALYFTCPSANASTSFEPVLFYTTMAVAGQVGGRVRAFMTTNVALGGWSNAFKAEVTYGTSGRTTGLGSALLAEMTMSAGCTQGTYAPLEVELNMGASGVCGTSTGFIFLSVNDAASTTFDTSGVLFTLQGVASGSASVWYDATLSAGDAQETLKVKTPSGIRYIALYDSR